MPFAIPVDIDEIAAMQNKMEVLPMVHVNIKNIKCISVKIYGVLKSRLGHKPKSESFSFIAIKRDPLNRT